MKYDTKGSSFLPKAAAPVAGMPMSKASMPVEAMEKVKHRGGKAGAKDKKMGMHKGKGGKKMHGGKKVGARAK